MNGQNSIRTRLFVLKRPVAAVTSMLMAAAFTSAVAFALAPSASADVPPGPQPVQQRTLGNVTADELPTVQIDGVVWSQAVLGNTVYAGGQFANARPAGAAAGTNLTPRTDLLAYDITTGNLITSFNPVLNGEVQVVKLSPDGTKLYIGGNFTTVNGQNRYRIASFNTSDGSLTSFAPVMGSQVNALAVTNSTVYAGGYFNSVSGVSRTRLAAMSATTGAVLNWAPTADDAVNAIQLTPDGSKVVVAGDYTNLNGSPAYGLGAVDATSGASVPYAANQTVQAYNTPGSVGAGFFSLSADATTVYATAWNYAGGGNFEGTVATNPADGSIRWMEDCHGDTYDTASLNGVVYTVSHAHYCGTVNGWPGDPTNFANQQRHAVAFTAATTGTLGHNTVGAYPDFYGEPAPSLINWFPDFTNGTYTSSKQAAWSLAGNSQYLAVGGEFPTVNSVAQQGLVRFAVPSIAPDKERPRNSGPNFPTNAKSFNAGTVRVSWTANWDRDDTTLTYKLIRDGKNATPIYTTNLNSQWWNTPAMSYTDTGLVPGSTHTYTISVVDSNGNLVYGTTTSVTVATTNTQTAYDQQVIADGASSYWPFNEASGTTAFDNVGSSDLTTTSGVTRGATGPVTGEAASTFDGSTGSASTASAITAPNTFTESAWVQTTSTSGGKIIGFGSSQTGNSGSYDRQIYLDNAGHVIFGVYPGSVATLVSSATINDGQWHLVTASLSSAGMALYIDGLPVASRTDVTSGQGFTGYWRVGGDNLSSWTNQPSSFYLQGNIGDVAIFPTALSRTTIRNEYTSSGRSANIPAAPTDAYGKAVYADNPDVYWRLDDASGPTALDTSPNKANGVYSGGETFQSPSTVTGSNGTGVTFNGSNGTIGSAQPIQAPTVYSEEAWFKTTTSSGGKIMGFGDQQSANSSNYDRHVYMLDSGQLVFGTYTNTTNTATTPASYNDGNWHYVVATQGPDGMTLYVDGKAVATNPQTQAQPYSGYWRVGGDSDWGGDSPYFNGEIDEVAFYDSTELTPTQVLTHYKASPAASNIAPTASYTWTTSNLTASFNGAGSSDSDGTVASYSWNFGDGSAAGTGVQPQHTYAAAGTYSVVLTVTDNQGATGTVTNPVTVTAPANIPPTASFSSTSSNLTASFNGAGSSDSDGTVASYSWNFGDGSAAGSGVSPQHTYAAAGTYSVVLTVTDNQGATGTVTNPVTVTPANIPPTASFSSTTSNLTASFNGAGSSDSDGTVASYSWNFGDGSAAGSGVSPQHTYAAAGTYSVVLTVTDNQGATGTVTNPVTVTAPNIPPTASFSSTTSNLTASFNGAGSSDSDGTVASYSWNFGDGSAAGSGVSPQHTYAAAGTYSVVLTVTDNQGATGTVTNPVTVTAPNIPPTASFSSTTSNLTASFNGAGSSDSDGTVASYSWNFGDGSAAGSGVSPQHTYAAAGTYSVVLTVTDNQGATGTVTNPVTVAAPPNVPPTASFSSTTSNLTASFNGAGSSDSDGTVASYSWNFGDGSAAGSGVSPQHTYAAAGTYSVVLTVTDNQGATGTVTKPVTVSAANIPPTASFSSTTSNLTVNFNGTGSTDQDGTVASYSWNFGDGTALGTGVSPQHTYAAAGTYNVVLTVTDNQGATGTVTNQVTVTTVTVASDTFTRTTTGSLGTADTGGAWTLTSGSLYSTNGSTAKLNLATAPTNTIALLNSVSQTNINETIDNSISAAATGGGTMVGLIARHAGTSDYRLKERLLVNGVVHLAISRVVNNVETTILEVNVAGLTYNVGDTLRLQFVVIGSTNGSTTLTGTVWKVGATMPTAPQISVTDSTASLQGLGSIGLLFSQSSTSTAPVVVTLDNFLAVKPN